MNYEDLPLCRTSLKIMKFWGFIGGSHWRQYTAIIPSLLLCTGQFADILLSNKPIEDIIRDSYFVVLWFNSLIRTSFLAHHRPRYEEFLNDMVAAYKDIEMNEAFEIREMLAETTNSARSLANLNFGLGNLACAGIILYPLFTSVRALPYGAHIPWVDKHASPWYELLYVYQFFVTIPGCCMYIPFTNLVVTFIMFGILMNKVLMGHLSKLRDRKREEVWAEVVWCIRYQMQIIRYVDIVNYLTTYISLVEFLSCGTLLCALLFLLNMVDSLAQIVIVMGYIAMIFAQISAMYWFANELYHQSVEVALEAYSTDWFDFDLKTRRALQLLITRAQRPCAILVGNVYPMTLEMFQSLLNATYTYFTLLRRFYE